MNVEETTPMERMILWIESGCTTDGHRWEEWKQLMLKSEQVYARHIATHEINNFFKSKEN